MEKSRPYWLIPNLMSLDAPIVAVVWAWIFSETWRVHWVNQNVYYLLPGIVWVIYVLDRFLDNKSSGGKRAEMSSRHRFHEENWTTLKFAVFAVAGFCLAISLQMQKGIYWHVIPVLFLVAVYFFLALISGGVNSESSLFKNAIAGFTFSYGVSLGIHFFRPSTEWSQLLGNTEMILFGALCFCNINAIDVWEASRSTDQSEEKATLESSLTIPLLILTTCSLLLALEGSSYARPFYFSIMIGAGLLQLINSHRNRFSLDALRAMADGALILPAPIFWVYMQYLK